MTQITNYKGFGLEVRADDGFKILSIYSSDLTNQIALLNQAVLDKEEIIKDYVIELGYKIIVDGDYEIDFALDVDKWFNTDYPIRERIIISLLNEEIEDIERAFNDWYNYN